MNFRRIWFLRGPNYWARVPVVEAELELGERDQAPLPDHFLSHLRGWLPQVPSRKTHLADVFLQAVVALQRSAGDQHDFCLVHRTSEPGFYRLVFAFTESAIAQACLDGAHQVCLAAWDRQSVDVAALLQQLRAVAHESRLGPSTAAIVNAALQRGIPTRRLNAGSLVQLGWGARQHRIWTAETDQTTALGETIAQDKQLTRSLLYNLGVPVPTRPARHQRRGRRCRRGRHRLPGRRQAAVRQPGAWRGRQPATPEQVVQAHAVSARESSFLMVEKYVPGDDYRLLVVGDRLAAASLREPAHVIGDGKSTIHQLIDLVNTDPRRSDGHATALSFIKIDAVALGVLEEQGLTPGAIPLAGQKVLIRRNANLSTGGAATDVTDQVHPDVAAKAVDAARAVGLDIAGVDVVSLDIRRPLAETDGAVVEVNAGPGLRMHLEPSAGLPRPVGEHIVDSLFAPGETGRIPIVAVTGTNGKTTTTRLLAHLFRSAGHFVGMTCTDGIFLDGRRTATNDCSGPQSARQVLLHPQVNLAVLETARGGILREGLGFDSCDCAVVTNVGKGDHLGLRGIETLAELARVKRVLVEAVRPEGYAVLNAADPLVVDMALSCPGQVIFFAADAQEPTLLEHRRRGGKAVFQENGCVILAEGTREINLLRLAEVPLTQGGKVGFQVENVLAAAAAAWAVSKKVSGPVSAAAEISRAAKQEAAETVPDIFFAIPDGLRSFPPTPAASPGRFNVLAARGGVVIVDYAHNPSAVAAMVAALDQFPQAMRTLVFSGCDRRDIDLVDMGQTAGSAFDRVILYADWGHSGRADGELNALLRQGLNQSRRMSEIRETSTEREAIDLALADIGPGKLVVLGVETIEESLRYVQERLR